MTKYDLVLQLQEEAEKFDLEVLMQQREEVQKVKFKPGTLAHQTMLNTIYNVTALISLKTAVLEDNPLKGIHEKRLYAFQTLLDQYLEDYVLGGELQKSMIKLACTYLAFIEEKPLHPVGSHFDGQFLEQQFDQYYCPQKARELENPDALCHFCSAHCKETLETVACSEAQDSISV
ncbi:DUF2115 family protein [Eubacterium sp. 1001713B170207_170306_E7]|uniref:DUF2115 family protein n=1 Tax=Eubacterium sp. 1001713B170207_170306_E7 TaxID=2787097 RepID=UPI001898CD2D|nr:DUF2115 family protein [Eubacterium sp. 1001713B170207_170306_E7]